MAQNTECTPWAGTRSFNVSTADTWGDGSLPWGAVLNRMCPGLSPLVVVQLLSHVQLFVTLWSVTHQASLSFTTSQGLLKLMSIESVLLSNHLILCRPLFLSPSIFPSIRVFSDDLALCIRWPKYWSFSFSISPSNECSGLISFRMDWLDLLAVQGTLKSLLQHHLPLFPHRKPSLCQW